MRLGFKDTDVLVVGGGPVGLAAAISARLKGLEVTVADGARPPIDKACGEGVMPDGAAALESLGVDFDETESFPFHGIRFVDGDLSAEACFPAGQGLGIRRTVLHERLVERARELGVTLRYGVRVHHLEGDTADVGEHRLRFRWAVGADGQQSLVRRAAGLGSQRKGFRRLGFRRHYRITPWTDFVEVYWESHNTQAYVTPVSDDEVCIAVIGPDREALGADFLSRFPTLADRLARARPTSRLRGGVSASYRVRRAEVGRVALVGDAAGCVDAITGEGLSIGFQQAVALAGALAARRLSLYRRPHRRIGGPPRQMARLLLLMGRSRWIRRRALTALASERDLFRQLLGVHVGALPLRAIGFHALADFTWQLLTAGAAAA